MNEPELTQGVKLRIREKIMVWQVLLAKKVANFRAAVRVMLRFDLDSQLRRKFTIATT